MFRRCTLFAHGEARAPPVSSDLLDLRTFVRALVRPTVTAHFCLFAFGCLFVWFFVLFFAVADASALLLPAPALGRHHADRSLRLPNLCWQRL